MAPLTWDQVGERTYETGIDRGVLYIPDGAGVYANGFAWNGLTTVTESPTGAESNPQYADNIMYLNLLSAELFGATIEAFTYPDEFAQCDGIVVVDGVAITQQIRKHFGLCYRSRFGNDVDGTDHGYKLHLVYGALAAPSERAYATINDSPEAISFSWDITTTAVEVPGHKPSALLTIASPDVDSGALSDLEDILYGTDGVEPRLPLPAEVISVFAGGLSVVRLTGANAPTYNGTTHVVTLPSVVGVQWQVNGVNKAPGAQPALTVGQTAVVTALPTAGHEITGDDDWAFDY
jgi:hypothetical protein